MRSTGAGWLFPAVLALACAGTVDPTGAPGDAGADASPEAGGATSSGGASTGGALITGGAPGGTGGSTSTGGALITGGAPWGTGGSTGGANNGGTAGGFNLECNTLWLDGPPVTPTPATGQIPTPLGGTIADGHWVLVSYATYNAVTTTFDPIAATYDIRGSLVQYVYDEGNGIYHQTFTLTPVSATQVRKDLICPSTATITDGFTATPTEITFMKVVNEATAVYRLSKTGP